MPDQNDKPQESQPPETGSLDAPADTPIDTDANAAADTPFSAPADSAGAGSDGPKRSVGRKLVESKFLYLWIFIIIVVLGAAAIIVTIKWGKNPAPSSVVNQKLTAQQLAALTTSTTTVGDSQQTLNVQSNSVFQGQVLIRQNLEVAGTLKVGGGLSLPTINVGGAGSFGQLQVNSKLSVAGDAVVQGQLNVQKNLAVTGSGSFGSLSASSISVTNLQINGDFTISRHLIAGGGAPTKSNGAALGSGGTASVGGGDTGGTVTINTGSGPAIGCFITVNFAVKFPATPHVVISPSNSSAGGLEYYADRSSTGFSVCTASTPAAGTTYVFDYIVIQ